MLSPLALGDVFTLTQTSLEVLLRGGCVFLGGANLWMQPRAASSETSDRRELQDEADRGHLQQARDGVEGPGGEARPERAPEDRARDRPADVVDAGVRPGQRGWRGHHHHYGRGTAGRDGGADRPP